MNIGTENDIYTLNVTDNAGWNPTLSDNLLGIPACENRQVTLRVTIPENAELDTEDNIIVTATSMADNRISDNDSCTAYVLPSRRVEIFIMPGENYALPGENTSFAVLVKNTGMENDNYDLTVEDTLGWPTSLSENLFEDMEWNEGREATLTVIIPENAVIGEDDYITVTATSQENENVSDNAICIARCNFLIYIDGNDNFTPVNGVNGGGSGTVNDPYIIEDWDIDASVAHGIEIRNTTAHFVIRNCVVENGWVNYYGIYLDNVVNGRIENNTCENNFYGISLGSSDNNTLSNNTYENNYWGIYLSGSDNNTLDNNNASNNIRGIDLSSSSYNNLTNNTFENNNDGILLWYSDNNALTNNTCVNNGEGLSPYYSPNNTLDNNTIKNNDYGIWLWYSDNTRMRNNILSNNQYNFGVEGDEYPHFVHDIDTSNLVNGKPIRYLVDNKNEIIGPSLVTGYLALVNGDNILVENLALRNNIHGILLAFTENSRVENCIFKNNYDYGIYLWNSDNNTLDNNNASNNGYGIYLYDSDNNTLDNNTCENNLDRGIRLYISDNNTLINNTVKNNPDHGIYLSYSENNRLRNNSISNNLWNLAVYGWKIYHFYQDIDTSNTIDGRSIYYLIGQKNLTIDGNTGIGHLGLVSCENILVENLNIGRNDQGILLANTSRSTIRNSTSKNNHFGIYLWNSDNNLIYHNNFVNNDLQARDSSSNYWDDGYPSGGNYWSDYTGEDNFQGENQAVSGSDGIGDTPYNILGGANQDRYPLMNPVVSRPPIYIDGNNNFIPANGVTSGSGMENDPYIIENLDISAWNAHGIEIRNTTAHFIIRNYYVHDGGSNYYGIYFDNVVNGKIDNLISDNNRYGIHLLNSNNIIIVNNIVRNNYDYGIRFGNSDNNHIYHNNFTNNVTQAYDPCSNYWDDGYPSGGNYWSDYVGSDANGDGIGDTPYSIPGDNNQDRYPLMNPWPVSHLGTASFSMLDLYTLNVEKILDLGQGSKLVVKFYTYGDAFENENVIENFSPPWHVEENESARHPEGIGVKKVRLDLTTADTSNVIETIASFTVTKTMLEIRFTEIPFEWALAGTPGERTELETEFTELPLYWALAPD